MLPMLVPVATCRRYPPGLSHGQTACEPARGREGRVNCKISRDRRFQPPNTVPKKEELQLAEASFRDNQPQISVDSPIYL